MRRKVLSFLKNDWQFIAALLAIYICVTGLFVYGSVCDLDLALGSYSPSSALGRFVAGFGMMPLYITMFVVGGLAAVMKLSKKAYVRIIQWVVAVALYALAIYLGTVNGIDYRSGYPLAATFAVMALSAILSGGLTYYFCRNVSGKALLRASVMLAAILLAEYAIGEIVKPLWSRPRPYLLFELGDTGYFLSWFQAGAGKALMAKVDTSLLLDPEDLPMYFESFPSGHTSHAALLIPLLGIMLSLKPFTRRFAYLGAVLGFGYALLVAYGRMVMGAHYLSDTMAGLCLTFLVYLAAMFTDAALRKDISPMTEGKR